MLPETEYKVGSKLFDHGYCPVGRIKGPDENRNSIILKNHSFESFESTNCGQSSTFGG